MRTPCPNRYRNHTSCFVRSAPRRARRPPTPRRRTKTMGGTGAGRSGVRGGHDGGEPVRNESDVAHAAGPRRANSRVAATGRPGQAMAASSSLRAPPRLAGARVDPVASAPRSRARIRRGQTHVRLPGFQIAPPDLLAAAGCSRA